MTKHKKTIKRLIRGFGIMGKGIGGILGTMQIGFNRMNKRNPPKYGF